MINYKSEITRATIDILARDGVFAALDHLKNEAAESVDVPADQEYVLGILIGQIDDVQDRLYSFVEKSLGKLDATNAKASGSLADKSSFNLSPWVEETYELAVQLDSFLSSLDKQMATDKVESLDLCKGEAIAEQISGFLAEEAMLQFKPNLSSEQLADEERALQTKLGDCRNQTFYAILNLKVWDKDKMKGLKKLLFSPLLDEQSLILFVSALNLCNLRYFSKDLFELQEKLYLDSPLLSARMYALVGMLLSSNFMPKFWYSGELKDCFVDLARRQPAFLKDLYRVQKWLGVIAVSEQRSHEFASKMMGGLYKASLKEMNGETEEERVKRIISSDDEEEELPEDIKDAMETIIAGEQKGYDLYVGQFKIFSKAKFFENQSSWFLPFDEQNPEVLDRLAENPEMALNVKIMQKHSDLCDSDLYGFVDSFGNNKKMLEKMKESVPPELVDRLSNEKESDEEAVEKQTKKKWIRNYLRELIRFFLFCPSRKAFSNPFKNYHENEAPAYCVLTNGLFGDSIFDEVEVEAKKFAEENNINELTISILDSKEGGPDNLADCLSMASALLDRGDETDGYAASTFARQAIEIAPDNEEAAFLLFDCGILTENNADIITYGPRVIESAPADQEDAIRLVKLQLIRAYMLEGMIEEALKIVYELNYDDPDDEKVLASLAYCLLHRKKGDRAEQLAKAEKIVDSVIDHDVVNTMNGFLEDNKDEKISMKDMFKLITSMALRIKGHAPETEITFYYCKGLCSLSRREMGDAYEALRKAYIYAQTDEKLDKFFKKLFWEDAPDWLKPYGYSKIELSLLWEKMSKKYLDTPRLMDFENAKRKFE